MDGRDEPRAALAMQHAEGCPECAEWRREVQAAHRAMQADKLAVSGVDLSGAIMASLPARHPASYRTTPAFAARKLVILMAACWLLGAIMMAAGIGLWTHYHGTAPHVVAASAKASAGAAGSVARSTWQASGVLLSLSVGAIVETLARAARGILTFFIVDTLVLLLAAIIWRKRRTLAGPFCVMLQSIGGI